MGKQLNLFDGPTLRDAGIEQAVQHANEVTPQWSDMAFDFLRWYAGVKNEFMVEDVRRAAEGIVPEPPSTRAWGGVVVRVARAGWIRRKGFAQVTNPKAHCATATVWEVTI
jgi:hypothetical protein